MDNSSQKKDNNLDLNIDKLLDTEQSANKAVDKPITEENVLDDSLLNAEAPVTDPLFETTENLATDLDNTETAVETDNQSDFVDENDESNAVAFSTTVPLGLPITEINYTMNSYHIGEIVGMLKSKKVKIFYLAQGIFFALVFAYNVYAFALFQHPLSLVLCAISLIFGFISFGRNYLDIRAFSKRYIDGKAAKLTVYKNTINVHHEDTEAWNFDLDSSVLYRNGLDCLLLTQGQTTLFVPLSDLDDSLANQVRETVFSNCNKFMH